MLNLAKMEKFRRCGIGRAVDRRRTTLVSD